jgi:bifunctional DNA-binding transcriptional regulator/antitoxin component of YhaV-PrlF toxin-antitoxin module
MKNVTLQKVTTRGQITLPISWRRKHATHFISVEETEHGILITPAVIDTSLGEYTVFDALRDNKGKGIYAKDLAKMLKKIDK